MSDLELEVADSFDRVFPVPIVVADWDDVLDPKWKDRILIRNPIESGSMRAIWGAMILRSIRETGSPEGGYEWLRRLDANVKEYTADPSILYQKLGRQEGVVTLYNMPDIVIQQERGYKVDYVFPSSGTPLPWGRW